MTSVAFRCSIYHPDSLHGANMFFISHPPLARTTQLYSSTNQGEKIYTVGPEQIKIVYVLKTCIMGSEISLS